MVNCAKHYLVRLELKTRAKLLRFDLVVFRLSVKMVPETYEVIAV